MSLTIPDVIKKKRDGAELSGDEIDFFIRSVVEGTASEGQIGAWLMAVYINGMTDKEISEVTRSMVSNGEQLKWDTAWDPIIVDKHSTGGIGDKTSLVLAPALAACGLKVPMISGRGLGITGGTLDKLESIPGFRVILSQSEMRDILRDVGCFIAGQTEHFAPADRALYKLRDVTQTVNCIPLIVSSILSKKAVEGTRTLVMDLKVGSGSLVRNEKLARELSNKLIDVSKQLGISTSIVMTDMNTPIGRCIGNSLEVAESVDCLRNRGPDEIRHLVKILGGILLMKTGISRSIEEGGEIIVETLANGSALSKFRDLMIRQGVSEAIAQEICNGNCLSVLPIANNVTRFRVPMSGVITAIDAEDIGKACWLLGAGRRVSGGEINYNVGVKLLKLTGDSVQIGDEWLEAYHNEETLDLEVKKLIQHSLKIELATSKDSQSRIINILGL